jgi:hypothetical protein
MFEPFFGVPQSAVRLGLWAKMKPGEKDLYICLMHRSERYSSREINVTDDAVRQEVGAAPRTLCNARKRLQEYGLIQCGKISGNKYRYIICDPNSGKPYPGDSRHPIRYKKRDREKPERRSKPSVIAETAPTAPSLSKKAAANGLSNHPGMTEHGLFGIFDSEGKDGVPF